ncbi:MAG: hypothetical protein V1793_13845 [Pseudomonadota bacterium]
MPAKLSAWDTMAIDPGIGKKVTATVVSLKGKFMGCVEVLYAAAGKDG